MKRNVVLAVTARLAASLCALLLLVAVPAAAADKAMIDIIGYSENNAYFAFEEFGIHDGSGAAFASIYIVDLGADKWVYGVPYTVDATRDDDPEAKPLSQVRAEALAKARDKLNELAITAPYTILALNGDGERADMKTVNFWTPNCCAPDSTEDARFALSLATMPITKPSDDCAAISEGMDPIVGFTLEFTDASAHSAKTLIHEDGNSLPRTRGCTIDYGIYAVIAPMDSYTTGRVAIIETWQYGFEGPDRRFLAVPIDG